MSLLLDTHALIWWTFGDEKLPNAVQQRLAAQSEPVFVSAVSALEIAIKRRIGKLPNAGPLATDFIATIDRMGFTELPITVAEAALAGRMEGAHRDPFDRLLIAQGLLNGLTLISNERIFDGFGVARLW